MNKIEKIRQQKWEMKVILYFTRRLTSEQEAELEDEITQLAEDKFPSLDEIEFDYSKESEE